MKLFLVELYGGGNESKFQNVVGESAEQVESEINREEYPYIDTNEVQVKGYSIQITKEQ